MFAKWALIFIYLNLIAFTYEIWIGAYVIFPAALNSVYQAYEKK